MALARRASLVVVLLLLASVGTACAECSWVLWGYGNGEYFVVAARESRLECEAAAAQLMREKKPGDDRAAVCLPDTVVRAR